MLLSAITYGLGHMRCYNQKGEAQLLKIIIQVEEKFVIRATTTTSRARNATQRDALNRNLLL